LNLNSDLGEGAGEDEAILALIDSANVACGVHAGSVTISVAAVAPEPITMTLNSELRAMAGGLYLRGIRD